MKKFSTRGKRLEHLSKLPHTWFLRATALCAAHALAVYDRFQVMSSTFLIFKNHAVNMVVGMKGEMVKAKYNNFRQHLQNWILKKDSIIRKYAVASTWSLLSKSITPGLIIVNECIQSNCEPELMC